MNELLEEIKYTTYSGFGSKHDDGIDCISQIAMIDARYPPKDVEDEITRPKGTDPLSRSIWGDRWVKDEDDYTEYDSYA